LPQAFKHNAPRKNDRVTPKVNHSTMHSLGC